MCLYALKILSYGKIRANSWFFFGPVSSRFHPSPNSGTALARGQLKASSKMQIRFGTGFVLDLLRTPLPCCFISPSPLFQGKTFCTGPLKVYTSAKKSCISNRRLHFPKCFSLALPLLLDVLLNLSYPQSPAFKFRLPFFAFKSCGGPIWQKFWWTFDLGSGQTCIKFKPNCSYRQPR